MSNQIVPTKGNLMNIKKSLNLARVGYELLDKKRNILIREMMALIDKANEIQSKIDATYANAYRLLQIANITLGYCDEITYSVPIDDSLSLKYRSVMGVEIPILDTDKSQQNYTPYFGLYSTNSNLDMAYIEFNRVKELTVQLAEVENSIYRLSVSIKKSQKRANALKNIIIPRFAEEIKFITDALDEKEREEFTRLKVIKRQKKQKEHK